MARKHSSEEFRGALSDNNRERVALDKQIAELRQQLRELNKEHYELAAQLQEAVAQEASANQDEGADAGDEPRSGRRDGNAPGASLTAKGSGARGR